VANEQDIRQFVNDNWNLALYIVQQVPYILPPGRRIDWEHLYAVALTSKMRWRGPGGGGRPRRYDGAYDVWHTGNLFALDESLNRASQDSWPAEKLKFYDEKGLWPPSLFLSPTERKDLLASCELFKRDKVADGMPKFRGYVRARELRIFEELQRRYPRAFVLGVKADNPARTS
jgi:hypothetical protein